MKDGGARDDNSIYNTREAFESFLKDEVRAGEKKVEKKVR